MSNSIKASTTGLEIVDKARQRLGWTKTSTARWWQDAHTSKATLRRFWQGDRIQKEIFIAICQAVGISAWESIADSSNIDLDIITPLFDWNEAPNIEGFYGRNEELSKLENWLNNGCKLINIVGIGGIGKTSLVLAIADRMQSQFDCLIWKSLYNTPSLTYLIDNLLISFNQSAVNNIQKDTLQIIRHLQQRRCLLILDGLDAVLSNSEFIKFIQETTLHRHQSCIITTSREKQNSLEANTKTVCYLTLNGLGKTEALDLLKSRGFTGQELGLSVLIQLYRGNPLAIKLVITLIESVFGGNVAAFLNQNTIIVGDRILNQLYENLWQVYSATLGQILNQILPLLQNQSPPEIGYISSNITALIKRNN
jgi:hypothetical protein